MSFFDKAKEAASKAKDVTKGAANKVKDVAKNYTDDLKQQEAKNKEIASAPMEERIKMRPDGVKYCIVNNTGKILDVDRQSRSFTALSDGNLSSIIRFNVARDALILDRAGRPIHFSRLIPGLRVRIRHAAFMTASIPPQTTAFEIRVL